MNNRKAKYLASQTQNAVDTFPATLQQKDVLADTCTYTHIAYKATHIHIYTHAHLKFHAYKSEYELFSLYSYQHTHTQRLSTFVGTLHICRYFHSACMWLQITKYVLMYI